MSTLEALQGLDDAKFHRLCDELIPRISARYFPLTPHGVSSTGVSIKGQPDSFVGESIATASVAISYSIQKHRWWTKLLDDVQKARIACPVAGELVWATSRDTERDGNPPTHWLSDAEAACAPAALTVLGGRRLSHLLDTEHQDLRFQYLEIPHSRLTYESLVDACRKRTERATRDLQASGRYDANAYVVRRADGTLFELWEACGRASLARERPRLIPIVSDAGLGKTSLLCRFAESFASGLPVLFSIARDMAWQTEDAIVRFVTQAAEGVLEPHVRSGEEQSIARLLRQRWPLTVVLDGLDETHEPEQVRRALRYWLASPLAEESTLIVSSRPHFWALCEDHNWSAWTPSEYRRTTSPERDSRSPLLTRGVGFSFPELLNERELKAAWTTKGRAVSELASLGANVQVELSHPFTLRAFMDLSTAVTADTPVTRASILDRWITERLKAESSAVELLTPEVYRRSLIGLAACLRDARGWVTIDDLRELPRYDAARPPGRPVERLVAAGLIELSASAMEVRFGHESIADFFAGELDAIRAAQDPAGAADELLSGPYSSDALRLEVVGRHVKPSTPPLAFVERLARRDPARAILVMLGAPDVFGGELRALAVESLATEILGPFHARAAFAVDLLSRFQCIEARQALVDRLHPVERCPEHLRSIAAMAVARVGAAEAADVTYHSPLFRSSEPYYFADILHVLRRSTDDFREGIARLAENDLSAEQGSKQHVRAVYLLACVGDPRVVEHLDNAFHAGRELAEYENRALIAVGTPEAARLFAKSAAAAAAKIATLDWDDGGLARSSVFHSIATVKADIPHLLTPAFEELLATWLSSKSDVPAEDSTPTELKLMAIGLARTSRSRNLARQYVLAKDLHDRHFYEPVLDWLDPREWLEWWQQSLGGREKSALMRSLPGVPTPAVEAALVGALRHRQLTWPAARYLGDNGTSLAKTALRELVANIDPDDQFASEEAIKALGRLRDRDAVPVLSQVVRTCKPHVRDTALASLGLIGTPAAEASLLELLDNEDRVAAVSGALVLHGSQTAVRAAIDLSRMDSARGSKWLARALEDVLSGWGWRRGAYFSHIHDDFGAYLLENDPHFDGVENWEYFRLLERIDTPSIRAILRQLAQRRGSDSDAVLRDQDGLRASQLAYGELYERGDVWALPELIKVCVGGDKGFGRYMAEHLLRYPRHEVADAIRRALGESPSPATRAELNRLLGFFGGPADFEFLRLDATSSDHILANAADEALLRLEDPLRLPDNWSSLRS
jgi:hypothetical protein